MTYYPDTRAFARVRRRVFVSYHHGGDQLYYDEFSKLFHDKYEAITDTSLERRIDSASFDYIIRRIREYHLEGSSCTIVLCGRQTPLRKYVDWEVAASLQQQMGLVAIGLPTLHVYPNGGTDKPHRVQDNIDSGYAEWLNWTSLAADHSLLLTAIERANAKLARLIDNSRPRLIRNG